MTSFCVPTSMPAPGGGAGVAGLGASGAAGAAGAPGCAGVACAWAERLGARSAAVEAHARMAATASAGSRLVDFIVVPSGFLKKTRWLRSVLQVEDDLVFADEADGLRRIAALR